jgi:hypothetical protein
MALYLGEDKVSANSISSNYAEGYEAGKQAGYDSFWDAYQKNGKKTYYSYGFSHDGWNDTTFFPKYDMTPTAAAYMFWNSTIGNLAQRLRECNVVLDTSNATGMNAFAAGSAITNLPALSFVSAVNPTTVFDWCYNLVEIEKIIIKDDGSTTFTSWFSQCSKLTTITFDGIIGQNINFQWSPLSVDSMKSVITHLKNYSGTADAGKKTVKFTDDCWTALEADSVAPDGNTWRDYVETTLGWLT